MANYIIGTIWPFKSFLDISFSPFLTVFIICCLFVFCSHRPDPKEEEVLPDSEIPSTEAPSSEIPEPEAPATDTSDQELPLVETSVIIYVEKDKEEPISSTIILLDKEEELDEEKEETNQYERQEEIQNSCSILPAISSSCSCAASLQEYLHQQCSALLSKKRKCQTMNRKQIIPSIQTHTWLLPASPSACPGPQQHLIEVHQPHEKEQVSEQKPESGASTSQTPPLPPPPPPHTTAESQRESMFEPPQLEPSQTSNLPTASATDSSSAKPTPIVETLQLSSEEPSREPRPEKGQDMLGEEKHAEPSISLSSSSIYIQPSISAAEDESAQEPAEEKSETDASHLEVTAPILTPVKTKVPSHTDTPHSEHHPEPPAVSESSTSSELSQPTPDIITELEPSTETKTDNLVEEISASSASPSSSSPSLSDIYADPPNGTEQNGNQVHGSSQKESVFMRLNNRIKALEMNMSLSGRYLEQLSQR